MIAKPGDVYRKGLIELRCGDYRDVLRDVEPSCVIADPPYSARTHAGHGHGVMNAQTRSSDALRRGLVPPQDLAYARAVASGAKTGRRTIDYACWTGDDVAAFVERWSGVDGWIVPLSSNDMRPWYVAAYERAGRYATHQIPCCIRGMTVRLCGDGPASWAVYAQPSRPRWRAPWGALDGFYAGPSERVDVIGGKPLWLMRAIVRDYSRPGDLVCDPCAGGGMTLIAAALEGRRAIGAELDPTTFATACARIERTALTPPLVGLDVEPMRGEQVSLLEEVEG